MSSDKSLLFQTGLVFHLKDLVILQVRNSEGKPDAKFWLDLLLKAPQPINSHHTPDHD